MKIQVGTVDVSYVDPLSQKVSSKDARSCSVGHSLSRNLQITNFLHGQQCMHPATLRLMGTWPRKSM